MLLNLGVEIEGKAPTSGKPDTTRFTLKGNYTDKRLLDIERYLRKSPSFMSKEDLFRILFDHLTADPVVEIASSDLMPMEVVPKPPLQIPLPPYLQAPKKVGRPRNEENYAWVWDFPAYNSLSSTEKKSLYVRQAIAQGPEGCFKYTFSHLKRLAKGTEVTLPSAVYTCMKKDKENLSEATRTIKELERDHVRHDKRRNKVRSLRRMLYYTLVSSPTEVKSRAVSYKNFI